MTSKASPESVHNSEFMLAEYERLHSLVLDEIRQSEQRVSFFITIASTIGGALILFLQSKLLSIGVRLASVEVILVILLIYGLITLSRLSERNAQLKSLWKLQNAIQRYFAKNDEEVAKYLKIREELSIPNNPNSGLEKQAFVYLRGSIHTLVTLANSVICGGIVLTTLIMFNVSYVVIVPVTSASVALSAFTFRAYHYYLREVFQRLNRYL